MKSRILYLAGITLSAALFLILLANKNVEAEDYPTRPVEVIIPYAPGGTADVGMRLTEKVLSKNLGAPVILTNKGGAGTVAGAEYVAKSKPDGYTILLGVTTTFNIVPLFTPDLHYKFSDFIPLGKHYIAPNLFIVRHDSPIKDFGDLITRAKKDPGKLTCATSGFASGGHFNLEMLKIYGGINVAPLHYKSGGEANTAILGGHVDFGATGFPPVMGLLESGKVRGLAAVAYDRVQGFPNIPTLKELGYSQAILISWYGYFLPKGTPKPIVDKLAAVFEKTIKNPGLKKELERTGNIIAYQDGPAFTKYILEEGKVIEAVAKKANLIK